jgi:magnesium transporter
MLVGLPERDKVIIFRLLPSSIATDTFEYLDPGSQQQLLKAMGQEGAACILNEMSPDDRTALLEELPSAAVTQLLTLLSPSERRVAQSLLGYAPESVGRLMTPDYIGVRDDWTVEEVLNYVREYARSTETLDPIFALDEPGHLTGEVQIRELLLRPLHERIRDIRQPAPALMRPSEDQETAIALFKRYNRTVLPVVDSEGILLGIVTVDDVLDVAEAEATEDFQKLGGLAALDDSYLGIPLSRMIGKRAGWLIILFLGELLTATAMGFFEGQIAKAVVLALFVPLIISSGGNSGSQATTLIIRAMAVGEVKLRDWWQVLRREISSGFCLGGILGMLGFLRISAWSLFSNIYGEHWLPVALTVAFSLVGVILWGSLVDSMLPFLLRRLGYDPATASAPFVATLVDVTGIVIYFGVAIGLLGGTLL